MNTRFKYSLDQIKADKALICETEEYLEKILLKEPDYKTQSNILRRMTNVKRLAIVACVAVLLIGGGAKVYATPVSYVSVDINPSVELGINLLGQVVTAEGYNEDGNTILNGIDVTGENVTNAVNTVVDSAVDNGFITDDGSTVVTITAETNNENTATELNADAEAGAKEALEKNGKSAEILKDNVALARRAEARELGITPGKLNLIQKLQAVDSTATVEQYKDTRVKDIMKAIQAKRDHNNNMKSQDLNAGVENQRENTTVENQNSSTVVENKDINAQVDKQNSTVKESNQKNGTSSGNQGKGAGGR